MALIDPQQMGTLGKIGFVLQSAADPNFANTYLQNLEAQRQNQRVIATREEELAQRQADRAEEIRIRRLQEQRQAQEIARQDALRQAQAGLFSQPNVLGQLSQITGISPEAIVPYIQSGGDVSVLGQIQKLQQPIQPELPAGVAIPEGYQPVFEGDKFVGVKPLGGYSLAPRIPEGVDLKEGFRPVFENGTFIGQEPIKTIGVPEQQFTAPETLPLIKQDPLAPFQDKEKAQLEFLKQSEQQISELEKEYANEQNVMQRLQRFVDLSKVQDTGAHRATPFGVYLDSELQEMKSIQSEIAPKMRAVGSGSSSDKDVEMFKSATVSPIKNNVVNENIANARIAQGRLLGEKINFLREFQANYGHTKGADKSWKEYVDANPIFDKGATVGEGKRSTDFKLNDKRVSYQEYFRNKNTGGIESMSTEELLRIYNGQ